MDSNAKLTALGSKGPGGVAYMDGTDIGEIEIKDMAMIS